MITFDVSSNSPALVPNGAADKPIVFPQIGQRIRVLIDYQGVLRPLIWIRVAGDGSIYTGLTVAAPESASWGKHTVGKEPVQIKYSEATPLEGSELPRSSCFSFKASGEVHAGHQVAYGVPLRDLAKPEHIALFWPVHPSRYAPIGKRNERDFDIGIVGFAWDEKRPILGHLYVHPWPANGVVDRGNDDSLIYSVDLFLAFRGPKHVPNLVVQVTFGHGKEGPWQEMAAVFALQLRRRSC